jgi:hypothetical protein
MLMPSTKKTVHPIASEPRSVIAAAAVSAAPPVWAYEELARGVNRFRRIWDSRT